MIHLFQVNEPELYLIERSSSSFRARVIHSNDRELTMRKEYEVVNSLSTCRFGLLTK